MGSVCLLSKGLVGQSSVSWTISCIAHYTVEANGHPHRGWPRGLMDKASDFESEDCEFESRRGRTFACINHVSCGIHIQLY